jgi:hypothetical protein
MHYASNQEDKVERSAQFSLTGQIYTNASRVMIWLNGDDTMTILR